MKRIVLSENIFKFVVAVVVCLIYQELTISKGFCLPPPPEPPKSTPLSSDLLQYMTVSGVLGYGAWKIWKK